MLALVFITLFCTLLYSVKNSTASQLDRVCTLYRYVSFVSKICILSTGNLRAILLIYR